MKRFMVSALLAVAAAAGAVLAQAGGQTATIVVRVPADAKLTIGSQTTEQGGSERRFVTPELVPGYSYSYQVEATWMQGGKEVKVSRAIEFRPGKVSVFDLRAAAPQVAEVKQEPKKTVVKEEPKKTVVKEEPKKTVVKEEPKKTVIKEEPKVVKKAPPEIAKGTEPGFVALFNGKDLTGWKTVPEDGKPFSVRDGVIVVAGNPAGYFYTDKSYNNYVLRYDWKFIKNGNSGLLVHIQGKHQVWPKCIEVQGMQTDHGHIFAIGGAKGTFKTDRDNQKKAIKLLDWNTTEVVCKDGEITTIINGLPISTGKGDVTSGPFGFQSEGTELHFKNIRIKALPASAVISPPTKDPEKKPVEKKPETPKKEPAKKVESTTRTAVAGDGFASLFNGKNLDGWKTFLKEEKADPSQTFVVKNGEVQVSNNVFGYFYTAKSYKNYVLRYDWTYPKDQPEKTTMNSGLLVHIQEPHKIWPKSVEPQARYKDHGKLFFIGFPKEAKNEQKFDEAAQQKALKPHYEWNTTEATCKADGTIIVRINGVLVNEGKSELTSGPIGFQSEGARIHFKNIKIKMLD